MGTLFRSVFVKVKKNQTKGCIKLVAYIYEAAFLCLAPCFYLHYVTKSLQQLSEIGTVILHFTDREIEPERAPATYISSHNF